MNLILLKEDQFLCADEVLLNERQSKHLNEILKVKHGDPLDVGCLNGNMGTGYVSNITDEGIYLNKLDLSRTPPPQIPLTVILALPRPQMIKRILQTVACFGVKKVCLIQTEKVEKSFWQSPSIKNIAIEEQLILGLEQGKATQIPQIEKYQKLNHFFDTYRLENSNNKAGTEQSKNTKKIIAHPGSYPKSPVFATTDEVMIAIGPESGFISKEVTRFQDCGFQTVQLGERILKVETAVTALLSRFI